MALSEKTQAVGEIISTVNDISERTHLLALNAAIEAAAAGENGRSFAVVASEMKVLADQAKDATLQVRSILGDIQRGINSSVMLTEEAVKRVTAGKERTDTTQATITEISSRVQESVQTFQQIVASTNQQQLGIEQVTGALQNIRQASQQTAAGTRQLETAAANLSNLSQQLLVPRRALSCVTAASSREHTRTVKDIRKQLLAAFDVEHREHLHAIRSALDARGHGNVDLTDVFRRAHSLKGAARAVELPAVEEVAHQPRGDVSPELLEEKKSLDPATVAAVRLSLDTIEDLVAQIDSAG